MISDTFSSKQAKETAERHKEDILKRQRWAFGQISLEAGAKVESLDDIYAAIEANMAKLYDCPKCGKTLPTYAKVLTHTGNVDCRRRVAEKNGHKYLPPGMVRYPCKFCKENVMKCNWNRHEQSAKHKRNMGVPIYHCTVCNKSFTTKRAKRDLDRHLKSKKHLSKNVVLKV